MMGGEIKLMTICNERQKDGANVGTQKRIAPSKKKKNVKESPLPLSFSLLYPPLDDLPSS